MKITRNQLRRIIKEELESALNEGLVGSWKGAYSNGPELAMTYKLTGREFPIIKRLMSVTEKFSGLPKDERASWRAWPDVRTVNAMLDGESDRDVVEFVRMWFADNISQEISIGTSQPELEHLHVPPWVTPEILALAKKYDSDETSYVFTVPMFFPELGGAYSQRVRMDPEFREYVSSIE